MSAIESSNHPKLTPMLRQFYDIKSTVGDAILFFRMGDFYELFGTDAELVAPILDVVLTSREKGDQTKIPFCGVPHHSAKSYWLKLVKLGFSVAICDQLESPQDAKGLVKRGVTRLYTPGSMDELEGLESDQPNYLAVWTDVPGRDQEVLAVVDISTGELRLGNINRESLLSYIKMFRPAELLVRRFVMPIIKKQLESWSRESQLSISELPEAPLKDAAFQKEILTSILGASDLSSQRCGQVDGGQELLAALFSYIQALKAPTSQFIRVLPIKDPESFALTETVIRDLELFETSRRRQVDGSLAKVIDRTLSPMGARMLRYALGHPLLDETLVVRRHQAVGELVASGESSLSQLRTELKNTPDLARLSTRILSGAATPLELAQVRSALIKANGISPNILQIASAHQDAAAASSLTLIARRLVSAAEVLSTLVSTLVDNPTQLGDGRGVFQDGIDDYLDEKNAWTVNGEAKVAEYEEKLRKETGITSLKVRPHKAYGLLLEVTKTNLHRVPETFIRRQTMTNGERYTTIELRDLDEQLSSAKDQAVQRERQLYQNLLAQLSPYREGLMVVASALGELDLLQSFAWLALKEDYVRPTLVKSPGRLTLKGCRHPVVEKFLGRHEFVANDVLMNAQHKQLLITGPNMAGKSTVMRQTAVAAVLCQAGSWVPAAQAEMPIFDRIFTRVGASDDLSRGQSTFMVEMTEVAEVMRQATGNSLVILDEVGRGTSTTDGLAIAAAILEDLADRIGCYVLFATHYHELVPMMAGRSTIFPMQTEVLERDQSVVFTHRLIAGASGSSFGIEVAKLAGLPEAVLNVAKWRLTHLEPQKRDRVQSTDGPSATPKEKSEQSSLSRVQKELFALQVDSSTEYPGIQKPGVEKVLARLESIKIHKTTPLQALNIINELKLLLIPAHQASLFDEGLHPQ